MYMLTYHFAVSQQLENVTVMACLVTPHTLCAHDWMSRSQIYLYAQKKQNKEGGLQWDSWAVLQQWALEWANPVVFTCLRPVGTEETSQSCCWILCPLQAIDFHWLIHRLISSRPLRPQNYIELITYVWLINLSGRCLWDFKKSKNSPFFSVLSSRSWLLKNCLFSITCIVTEELHNC